MLKRGEYRPTCTVCGLLILPAERSRAVRQNLGADRGYPWSLRHETCPSPTVIEEVGS